GVLRNPDLDAAFKELVLTLPSEAYMAEQLDVVDPQRIHQAEPDDVPRPTIIRHRQIKVAASTLDGADDSPGRVKQSAIPVKNKQFIFHHAVSTCS
ncbi:MAG: hypothetical protein RLZZ300_2312, partial [Pseudomonadota bacterium]